MDTLYCVVWPTSCDKLCCYTSPFTRMLDCTNLQGLLVIDVSKGTSCSILNIKVLEDHFRCCRYLIELSTKFP